MGPHATPDYTGVVSVVVPVRDEADNVAPLIDEIHAALQGSEFELLMVDDGSADATGMRLAEAARAYPRLRVLRLGRSCGQSTAVHEAVRLARHPWIATLDGDGQNDPRDLPRLLEAVSAGRRPPDLELVVGWRTRRHDDALRRLASRVANAVRSRLLHDRTPDTGCGLKVFARDTYLRLPFFDHQHRFLPALFIREGAQVLSVPVNHRPRVHGHSKYGLHDRLWPGIVDLFGVMWLMRRVTHPRIET